MIRKLGVITNARLWKRDADGKPIGDPIPIRCIDPPDEPQRPSAGADEPQK